MKQNRLRSLDKRGMKTRSCRHPSCAVYRRQLTLEPLERRMLLTGLDWASTSLNLFGGQISATVTPDGHFFVSDGFAIGRSMDRGTTWEQVTPFGASTRGAIAYAPSDPSSMIAGASFGTLKSVTGGASWFKLVDLNAGGTVRALTFEPSNAYTVYAGIEFGGLSKSTDGGATWKNMLQPKDVAAVAVDPLNPQTLYVGTLDNQLTLGEVLKSTDGGSTWNTLLSNTEGCSILVDPVDSQRVYVGTKSGDIYRSLNGGACWTEVTGTTIVAPVSVLAFDPQNRVRLFAATGGEGVYCSPDGGNTWSTVNQGLTDLNVVAMGIQTASPHTIFVATCGGNGFWATVPADSTPTVTLSVAPGTISEAGGTATVTTTLSSVASRTVTVDLGFTGTGCCPADYTRSGTTITIPVGSTCGSVTLNGVNDALCEGRETITVDIVGVTDGIESGLQRVTVTVTDDDALPAATLSWKSTTLDLSNDEIGATVTPNGHFFVSDGFTIDRSVNQGAAWQTVAPPASFAGGAIAYAPSDPSIMIAGAGFGSLKSVDGGASWFKLVNMNGATIVRALTFEPTNADTVYAGTFFGGLFKSTSGGATWQNLLQPRDVAAVAIDPRNSQVLYVGTLDDYLTPGEVLKSTDGGSNLSTVLPNVEGCSILVDPVDTQRVYVGTKGGEIFRSLNGGATWTELTGSTIVAPVSVLAFDPQNRMRLFAATSGEGVYCSPDGGNTWSEVNHGLSDLNVVAMGIQTASPYAIFVATYGGNGFWTLVPDESGPPDVAAVTVNDPLLSDEDVGTARFIVTADFNEAMDTATMPVLTFAPAVTHTLTLNTAQSGWTDADTFVAKYHVADANVNVDNITIDVSGAKDVTGQLQKDFTPQSAFSIDTQGPKVINLWPMDNAAGVAVHMPLVMKFSEGIQKGVGNILIKRSSDNSLVESIAATSVRVAVSGEHAGIAPSVPLAEVTGYYVQIDSGAFKDLVNNFHAGISDKETWNFTTGNQLPTLDTIPDPAPLANNAGLQTVLLTGITAGPGEMQELEVTATSSNTAVVCMPEITYASPGTTGTLTWQPSANQTGTAVVTVTVRDAGADTELATNDDATFSRTFTVVVTPPNQAPTDLSLSNTSVAENYPLGTLVGRFTTIDTETPAGPFTYTLATGAGSADNSSFTIVGDQLQTNAVFHHTTKSACAIRVRTADMGGLWYEKAFVVTVQPVNDPPTLDLLSDLDVAEDVQEILVPLTGITAGAGDTQPLRVTSISSAPAIIPTPVVAYVSPETHATLRFTPLPNAFGSVEITVFVEDGGADGDLGTPRDNLAVAETFVVRVRAVPDQPVASGDAFTKQEGQTLNVQAPGVLSNDFDVDGDVLSAILVQSTTNGALQMHADGSFTYVPAERFNREDRFQYYVDDGTDRSTTVNVTIVVQTAYPWHNGISRMDVNDDGYISPIDALLVINELNANGGHQLAPDRPRPLAKPFLDVGRDGHVSPIDALLVINYLNGGGRGEGEGDVLEAARLAGSVLFPGAPPIVSPLTSAETSASQPTTNGGPMAWYPTSQVPEIGISPKAALPAPVFCDEPDLDWVLPDLALTLSEIAADRIGQGTVDEVGYPLPISL